jgi:hypothetical protein
MSVRNQIVRSDRIRSEVGQSFGDPIRQLHLTSNGLWTVTTDGPKRPTNKPGDVPGKCLMGIDWVERVTVDQRGIDQLQAAI